MKIFALETDAVKSRQRLVSSGEQVLLEVYYHGFLFSLRVIAFLVQTAVLVAVCAFLVAVGLPLVVVAGVGVLVWLFFLAGRLLAAYIDWRFDTLLVTTEKVVISNQTSIFHVEVRQMHLENIASVTSSTQMMNLAPFGCICFDLKEGTGQRICLKYIPHAAEVATRIAAVVTNFQRQRTQAPQRHIDATDQ